MRKPDKEAAEEFGRRLREERLAKNLSKRALARLAGLHPTTISMIEAGRREPRYSTMISIFQALESDVDELFRGIEFIPGAPDEPGTWRIEGRSEGPGASSD